MADNQKSTQAPAAEATPKAAEAEKKPSVFGYEPVKLEIPSNLVFAAMKAADWKFRDIPQKLRGSVEHQVLSVITAAVTAASEAAESAAYAKVERLIFQMAKQQNKTPQEVATFMGVQLKEKA